MSTKTVNPLSKTQLFVEPTTKVLVVNSINAEILRHARHVGGSTSYRLHCGFVVALPQKLLKEDGIYVKLVRGWAKVVQELETHLPLERVFIAYDNGHPEVNLVLESIDREDLQI